jgi:hypothetical protein
MQCNSKGSVGPVNPILYNGLVEASMQGYSNVSLGACISVHYNVLVNASLQSYRKGSVGRSFWFIVMAK